MKDFKYYLIFGISLIVFIYVTFLMPSVELLSDHSDELWFASADEWTSFYIDGVQGIDVVEQRYQGDIKFSDLKMQLDISIGKLQELYRIHVNTLEVYNESKIRFYEDFGITNYLEYDMLCNFMKSIFDNNANDKVLSAKVLENSIRESAEGLTFEVQIVYTSGNLHTLIVRFYNQEQEPLQIQNESTVLPTILKILPKVEE